MKILAIRGKNLASLEGRFEVDFTTGPLLPAGIFAITGSTGSGKTTLLDALCLALFDNTPRMSRAAENNIAILDVGDKTINQKDSRTLLRRGTAEGYAEVEFLSVAGEKFRATWSVKRARGRVDGSLQNTDIRLLNLSSGNEEQGRKTELLARIVELTGLTFEQFTRTVLLPQGDFAAFLKARQSEKAELLEKLTGTGVYSRISVLIYEKTRHAEQEYLALKERIKDVELLSDEQITDYHTEKNQAESQSALLKAQRSRRDTKIKWWDDLDALSRNYDRAKQSLADIQSRIAGAQPRYDYMARMDSVQDIRDAFNEHLFSKKQLDEKQFLLKQKTSEWDDNARTLAQVDSAYLLLLEEQEKLDRIIAETEPEIIRARELDVRIAGAQTNAEEAEKEWMAARSAKERMEKNIHALTKEIESAQANADKLAAWFDQRQIYREIIPQNEWILSLLDDAKAASAQSRENRNRQNENERLLETETNKLAALNAEAERLNNLLPAEIALLRAGLKEGTPCPVCGSLHHPLSNVSGEQSLKEKELNTAKQRVWDERNALTETIAKRKTEIARLQALAGNYSRQAAGTLEKAGATLSRLPSWRTAFEQGVLQNQIKEIARQWNVFSEEKTRTEGLRNNHIILLQSEQNNLVEANANAEGKEKKANEITASRDDLLARRKSLLKGKSVDELTAYFSGEKKKMLETVKKSADDKNLLTSKQEMLKGAIAQITHEIARLTQQCHLLQQTIDAWIAGKQGSINAEQLAGLLSKDKQWIQTERAFLNELKEQETAGKATVEERKKNLDTHNRAEIKPSGDSETKELLLERQTQANHLIEQTTGRIAEINAALTAHNKGKERIKAFEKELSGKAVSAENWKKLNELFGSASGSKFKEIAQGYTLDLLLTHANRHLQELSRRYVLQRIPETLALQVADLDMLGEIRTVHSLSGGESFLISLALALGLSSLMSNRMKIESLFIDEGFGSLDTETLRIAMDALEKLQMQGHKIGVISHVAEMTERIVTQIRVIKTANGRSKIEITGKP
ncbi:MAG: ATP-dependent exonuclease [Tannerellaceae bacterium]|jgi:exonuclease SbcC|nr:ATP-dependent exonuclease [Tannerellaceae bacterium]